MKRFQHITVWLALSWFVIGMGIIPLSASASGDGCFCYNDRDGCTVASTLGTLTAAESALVTQANTSACPDVNICIACQQVCENYFLTDHDRFVFIPEGATQDTFDFEIEQCNIAAGNPTATTEPEEPPTPPILPRLSVEIPGLTFTEPLEKGGYLEIDFIGQYVAALYKWMLGAGALIAVVMVMIGGLQYMIGKGAGDIQKGKDRMKNAVIGLILLLGSYTILYTVNPDLVLLQPIMVEYIPGDQWNLRTAIINPELSGTEEAYRSASCPSQSELEAGVKFFTTGYYKPAYGDAENYESFWCNIAMQCSCPKKTTGTNSCTTAAGSWSPCIEFDQDEPYCNATSSGVAPTAMHTAAASPCLPSGTVFRVSGSSVAEVNSTTWYAEDTGGWIKGRRVDLFTGTGPSAFQKAVSATGEVTINVCPDNDPTKCP